MLGLVLPSTWKHFEFIENCANIDDSCFLGLALRNWDPKSVRGLSVEPVSHLLARLPSLPNVYKVGVAIGSSAGKMVCTHVQLDASIRHPESHGVRVAGGTGMVACEFKTHPHLAEWLRDERIPMEEVVEACPVDVWTFGQLVECYKVLSVDVLKLDCEGCDLDILSSMLQYCSTRPGLLPRIVAFESNDLTPQDHVTAMIDKMCGLGYRVLHRGRDTYLKREPGDHGSLVPCCAFWAGRCRDGLSCYFDHVHRQSSSSRCCYGQQCLRGHGGVKPTCTVCGIELDMNQWLCCSCWSRGESRWKH